MRLKALVAALKEINIDEVLKNATAMPVAVAAAPTAQTAQAPAQEKKEEEKKEEEKKVSEEDVGAGLSSLFG